MEKQEIVEKQKIEKIVEQLKKEGWKEQNLGINYFNGEWAINLLKNGQMITIIQNEWPDEETVEELFGKEE